MQDDTGPFDPPLFIDNHLLVVVKPPGLLAQADRTGDPDVVSLARDYLKHAFGRPGNVFVGLVHRLDRPASGVMVLARTSKAAARLTAAFAGREVEKRYLAVVEGVLEGCGERTDHIRKSGERISIVPAGTAGGREASMRWRAVAGDGVLTLVEVELLTGRPHQARLQLAAMGAPILGDFRHGAKTRFADGTAIALHAWRLAFDHPVRRVRCSFDAPPPTVWKGLFDDAVHALQGTT
jgi:23S rRNA-/tRNA-specific pseudouridylate synthase